MQNPLNKSRLSRREFALGVASTLPPLILARVALATPATPAQNNSDEIAHTGESIHQEGVFRVAPERVFEALIDEKQFAKLTGQPSQIHREVGSSFSLFAGHITGRHVEVESPVRIIQAWRAESWAPHVYSIVRFEIVAEGINSRVRLDHTGFPTGLAESLASGWKEHYWEPLAKNFAC